MSEAIEQQRLYSVDDVAELLGLHVKTVRGYVRDGKLKATRIGKQYRIAASDLEEFTGHPVGPTAREAARRTRHVEVTTVVDIAAVDPETVRRISGMLSALMVSSAPDGGGLHLQTVYAEETAVLKLILVGGLEKVSAALRVVSIIAQEES